MKSNKDGIAVISRHGIKFPGRHGSRVKDEEPLIPGSFDDKHYIYITPESAEEFRKKGREILGDQNFEHSVLVISEFIRAGQSGGYFLEGGIPGLKDSTYIIQRKDIGFGKKNVDWNDPRLPKFGNEKEVADKFIKKFFEKFYFNIDEKLPCAAEMSYGYISSIIDGIEYLQSQQKNDGEKNLFTHFSHAPNVDTLAMIVLGCLEIDSKNRIVKVNDNYKGHTAMGEMFTGSMYDLRTDNPSLELAVKGTIKGYKVSDLKRMQAEVYEHANMSI